MSEPPNHRVPRAKQGEWPPTANADFEFKFGRSYLTGSGWRGLAALGLLLAFLATSLLAFVASAPTAVSLLSRFWVRFLP